MAKQDTVYFEAVLRSESDQSMFSPEASVTADNLNQFAPEIERYFNSGMYNVIKVKGFNPDEGPSIVVT